ncbi:hypothetical protein KR222_008558 [Zaprionus bogoriensis]|nr:hypothetical protein KR222_008558 [Zaprionus bogoriensis]
MQQVRQQSAICSPPRFPMTTAQRLIFGGIPHVIMLILPVWGVLRIRRWSALHNNRPLEEDDDDEDEEAKMQEQMEKEKEKEQQKNK